MANPPCMSDDSNPAVFVGTFLGDGSSVALCDSCMVAWSAALLNAMTGIDPTPFIMAISDDVAEVDLPPEGVETADGGPGGPSPPPRASSAQNGRGSRVSHGRGMVDARSDDERASEAQSNTPAA